MRSSPRTRCRPSGRPTPRWTPSGTPIAGPPARWLTPRNRARPGPPVGAAAMTAPWNGGGGEGPDVVTPAIKPQMLGRVAGDVRPHLRPGQLVLSVLAWAT